MLVDWQKTYVWGANKKISRPFYGTKQCWRDVVNNDLKTHDVPPKDWYALTMNRQEWYKLYTRRCSEVRDTRHPSVQCTAGDFNCGYGSSLCSYTVVMDNSELLENVLNLSVDNLSINKMISYGIQCAASSTFCLEVSQGQAIILGWTRQVTSVCLCVYVCVCLCACMGACARVCACERVKGKENQTCMHELLHIAVCTSMASHLSMYYGSC